MINDNNNPQVFPQLVKAFRKLFQRYTSDNKKSGAFSIKKITTLSIPSIVNKKIFF